MSSSVSADYSPASNYSYPTDLTLSPSPPTRQPRPQADQAPPPRLSSPNIFRDIFSNEGTTSTRSPHRLPPPDESFYVETMQGVIPAIQSASRAIQTAQEAFQTSRTPSANMSRRQDFVDLTNSPPSAPPDNRSTDSFLMRTLHPHDSRSSNLTTSPSLHQPFYPRASLSRDSQSLFVDQAEDPDTRYPGQSDSLAGARRRHELQRLTQRRPYMILSEMERFLRPGNSNVRRQEEEDAIRRQRAARQTWEQNQQRQHQREQEHDRLEQQRERLVARAGRRPDAGESQQSQSTSQETALSSAYGSQTMSSRRARSLSSATSSSSIEAIDLTTVNDTSDLTAALLHSQSNNPVGDPANPDSAAPRSALTAYKCPICLEPPRNATTTICGHLFCHECILETLKNSENIRREDAPPHRKVKGQCPVCRKELARKEDEGQTRTLVPLEIKLISKKKLEELRRLEKKRERIEKSNRRKSKGKEKALDEDELGREIFQLSSDDDEWMEEDRNGHKAKRVKLGTNEELDHELFGSYTYDDHS